MIKEATHISIIQQENANEEMILSSFLYSFEQHRGMLYAIALRLLGHGEDAKDAVQETFIKAYTHLKSLHNKNSFGAWLRSILFNYCMMELRSRKKKDAAIREYSRDKDITDLSYTIEKLPSSVKNFVAGLPEILQLTTMLRYFSKNSSYAQIAGLLHIPVGTVRSRLAESRQKLSTVINKENCFTSNSKAKYMEDFYEFHFAALYDDCSVRDSFFQHFHRHVKVALTSGKTTIGSDYLRKEVEFDLEHGARTTLKEVNSSGNISVLELANINPPDNPELCPAAATFILVHPRSKTEKAFLTMTPNLH